MNKWIAVVAMSVAVSAIIVASSINKIESQQSTSDELDSTTLLLDFKKIPSGDYIILYSVSPKIITSGGVVVKLPCDSSSEPNGWMLAGGRGTDLTTFQEIKVGLIQGTPGNICAFGATISNESASNIAGIILLNTGSDPLKLPRTSSVTVTVHEVSAAGI